MSLDVAADHQTKVVQAQQRLNGTVQAQADARSAETEEAYAQAALLDGALAAAEATQADLTQQVRSHVLYHSHCR